MSFYTVLLNKTNIALNLRANKMNKTIAIVIQIFFFISVAYANSDTLAYYSVSAGKLNVRSEPNEEAQILGSLRRYQEIDILEIKDGWAKIHQCNKLLRHNTCWISIDYLFPVFVEQQQHNKVIDKKFGKNVGLNSNVHINQILNKTNFVALLFFIALIIFFVHVKKTIINYLSEIKRFLKNIENNNQSKDIKNAHLIISDDFLIKISEIKNQLDVLQEYSFENKEKIRRFEDGYDWKIQKEFVIDIINVIEYIEKQNNKPKNSALETSIEDLNIMLENNGIYQIEITANKWQEVSAKVIRTEPTNDASRNDIIKEVLKNGYYIEIGDKQKIIRPAEVVIYKMEERQS